MEPNINSNKKSMEYTSHIFGIPSISNRKLSISIKIPSISIKTLGVSNEEFEILGFSHLTILNTRYFE